MSERVASCMCGQLSVRCRGSQTSCRSAIVLPASAARAAFLASRRSSAAPMSSRRSGSPRSSAGRRGGPARHVQFLPGMRGHGFLGTRPRARACRRPRGRLCRSFFLQTGPRGLDPEPASLGDAAGRHRAISSGGVLARGLPMRIGSVASAGGLLIENNALTSNSFRAPLRAP